MFGQTHSLTLVGTTQTRGEGYFSKEPVQRTKPYANKRKDTLLLLFWGFVFSQPENGSLPARVSARTYHTQTMNELQIRNMLKHAYNMILSDPGIIYNRGIWSERQRVAPSSRISLFSTVEASRSSNRLLEVGATRYVQAQGYYWSEAVPESNQIPTHFG